MSLATKLRKLRLKKCESLQRTADAVGITKTHIWEMEKGKSANPSAELLSKLADHFGVTVDFLIDPSQSAPTTEQDALVFYRELKSLDPRDQEVVRTVMKSLKRKS